MLDVAATKGLSPIWDLETWLSELTQTEPAIPLRWSGPRRAAGVRGIEHLSVIISSLADGQFGDLTWAAGGPPMWGQSMRAGDRWIIEVHDGSEDDFAQRVFRGDPGDYPARDEGRELNATETFAPLAAASILWAWQHGCLPDGLARTLKYLTPRDRRRYGLPET